MNKLNLLNNKYEYVRIDDIPSYSRDFGAIDWIADIAEQADYYLREKYIEEEEDKKASYFDLFEALNNALDGYFIYYGDELEFIKAYYGGDTFHAYKEAAEELGWKSIEEMQDGPEVANMLLQFMCFEHIKLK